MRDGEIVAGGHEAAPPPVVGLLRRFVVPDDIRAAAIEPSRHELGRDALNRFDQTLAVGAVIEAQCGHVDDGDVERLERGSRRFCDALEAGVHDMAGILGGEQQHGAACGGVEAAQAEDAGSDRDGDVQRRARGRSSICAGARVGKPFTGAPSPDRRVQSIGSRD